MQRGWLVFVALMVALAILATSAGPVFAEKTDGQGEKKGDSPPHIFTPVRIDLLIWTLLIFLILFFLLKKTAWGPILEGLHKREETIRSAVDEAKEARKETERLRAQFQKEMDEAFAKIPQMMDEARRDAARLKEEMRAEAATQNQADRQRLRREIEMFKDQTMQDLVKQTAQLATLISSKAIRRNISEEDHRRLVNESLDELRSAGRG